MDNKEIVKKAISAFLTSDIEAALELMADDIKMGWPGFFDLEPGKESIREFFKSVPELISSEVYSLIAEGNKVAGNGMVVSREENGSVKNSFFCDVYQLENGKIKEIKSYMVFEQKPEQ